jgi:hypothetical protein
MKEASKLQDATWPPRKAVDLSDQQVSLVKEMGKEEPGQVRADEERGWRRIKRKVGLNAPWQDHPPAHVRIDLLLEVFAGRDNKGLEDCRAKG